MDGQKGYTDGQTDEQKIRRGRSSIGYTIYNNRHKWALGIDKGYYILNNRHWSMEKIQKGKSTEYKFFEGSRSEKEWGMYLGGCAIKHFVTDKVL